MRSETSNVVGTFTNTSNSRYRAKAALDFGQAHGFPLRVCQTIDLNVREGPAILGQGDVDTSEHLRMLELCNPLG